MKPFICLACLLSLAPWSAAQTVGAISENDYLQDMPIIMSVSRLPQRLDETPGAVTLLDRDFIRRSGARDVADLLRLVPGFQTSTSFESAAPLASYHGAFDYYSNRMQILVDGRSVYSPLFIGSVAYGLQTVALEDIDRIEILRGSNSAAYGARAMLGVVNILTRAPSTTLGTEASVTQGENGVADVRASLGWALNSGSARFGLDRRADEGLDGAYGMNVIDRVNFRADYRLGVHDEVQLRAGLGRLNAGKTLLTTEKRKAQFDTDYAQFDWRRILNSNSDLTVNVSHAEETYTDKNPTTGVDFSGLNRNDAISLVHTARHGAGVQLMLGAEYRHEYIVSNFFYSTASPKETDFLRVFSSAEWRIDNNWVLNAGALHESSNLYPESLSPRVMLNWHMSPGHTLRAGMSKAYRPPSMFEKAANAPLMAIQSRGTLVSERLLVRELGYMADIPAVKLNLDLRVYREEIGGFIRLYDLVAPRNYINSEDFVIQGWEYQLKWQPWQGGQFILNQAYTDIGSIDLGSALAAPKLASSISFFQKFPGNFDLTLTHQDDGVARLIGTGSSNTQALTRTDLRLAKTMRWGGRNAELALVVQNLGLPYLDYERTFYFRKRAFMSLRFDL